MRAVKVQYTVKPDYVDANRANIARVMERLRADPIPGMQYATFILDDGQTFVHVNMARDQETLSKLAQVPEFGAFQAALKASEPLSPPTSEDLTLVGASFELPG